MHNLKRHSAFIAFIWVGLVTFALNALALEEHVLAPDTRVSEPVTERLRQSFNLPAFYKKSVNANGLLVVGSDKVSDAALFEAADLLNHMLEGHPDILNALIQRHVKVAVMATSELTTDIPEHSMLSPKNYWDKRARGLGGTLQIPVSSAAEENLLNLKRDRYHNENIFIHEFAHTIHIVGINSINPSFDTKLQTIYQHAISKGLWLNTYAATNYKEYWAETVQSYFDANDANNAQHNEVNTREKLAIYDPEIYALIDETFSHTPWKYVSYSQRYSNQGIGAAPQSNSSSEAINIQINNHTNSEALIYWVRGDQRKLYHRLQAGESFTQSTFPDEHWQAMINGQPIDFTTTTGHLIWTLQ